MIDTDEYSPDCPESDWLYLNGGVMVKTNDGVLVHYMNGNAGEISRDK